MKKILFFLILSGLAWAAYGQTPYDTVNVYDPQNFVEMTTIDTANGQIISRKNNLNRRVGFHTLKKYATPDVFATWVNTVFDSVGNSSTYYDYFVTDSTGKTWYIDDIGRGKLLDNRQRGVIDSVYIATDTLWIDENGVLWSIPVDSLGGGGGSGATIDSVFVRNDSIYVSESGTEFFALKDPTGRNTSAPTSFGGDGTNIHFQPRVQLGLNNTWREEFPGIAYNPYTGRLVAVYRYADNHAYSANGRGVAQYSDDFGKTWSDTVHFAVDRTAGEDKGVDPGIFYDQNTRLFLANATRREDANLTDELVIIYASPDGVTWATYDTIPKPAGAKAFRVANSLVRLQDNRLSCTGYTTDGAGADTAKVWFLHSSDNGRTWSSVLAAKGDNSTEASPNEGQLVQKPDGTLYVYARHNEDTKMYRYASTDDGATWSAAVDVTPDGYNTADNGSKPALHIFGDSTMFAMFRKSGSTSGSSAYSISTDWGATWTTAQDVPQTSTNSRWWYSAYTRIDKNGAFCLYSDGAELTGTGSDAPNIYGFYFSSGASVTGEQMQADVMQLREHTPGTLVEGSVFYDGHNVRFVDSTATKSIMHNNYNAQIGAASTTITLGSDAYKYEKIDCDSLTLVVTAISGGIQGGNYWFHFFDGDNTLVSFPASVKNAQGTEVGSITLDSAAIMHCLFDGTDFFCTVEGDVFAYSGAVSFSTIYEAVDHIGSPYLEINAALETEYADEASVDTLHDWSGNGRHFAASGASQPTYDSLSTTSGLPAFKFDGGDYATNTTDADWAFLHSDTSTIFIVYKPGNVADPNAAYGILGNNGTSLNNTGMCFFWDDRVAQSANNKGRILIGKGSADSLIVSSILDNGTIPANTYGNIIISSDPTLLKADSLGRMKISINGGADIQNNQSSSPGSRIMADIPSTASATFDMQIGAAGNNALPLVGEISVILIWDRILTPAEIAILQAAYENEYGP